MTRQTVAVVFAIPAKFGRVVELKLVLEAEIPSMTPILNKVGPDN